MENQEFTFAGKTLNGIAMLIFNLLVYVMGIGLIVLACATFSGGVAAAAGTGGGVLVFANLFVSCGFLLVEPGEARVMMFFGKYRGTFTRAGYYWVNPFLTAKKALAARAQPRRRAYQGERQDGQPRNDRHGARLEA